MAGRASKVLLVGWDAADWQVISPLLDAGEMPNLKRLVDGGVMGNLATLRPILSPMLWTSIATGKRAHKHGVHGFAEPRRGGGIQPVTSLSRRTRALWNMLSLRGLHCNVVGFWPTHPVEPIRGAMVSNHFQKPPNQRGPWTIDPESVHPSRLLEPLARLRVRPSEIDAQQILAFVPRAAEVDQAKDNALLQLAEILAETASLHAAATALLQLEPWDFAAVYFDAIDKTCHRFMRFHPPRLPWVEEGEFALYSDVVSGMYRFHDLMLGALLELAGPETTIVLVSDHGFRSDHLRPRELPHEPTGPADEHRDLGIIVLHGPGIRRDELVFGASLLDVAPTILTAMGLPIGADMDGRPLLSAFVDEPVVETIPSWDDLEGDAGEHSPHARRDPKSDESAIAQLVALGYIDHPDADAAAAARDAARELRYNEARDLLDARRLPEALLAFRKLWGEHPDESRFGVHVFQIEIDLGRVAEARASFEQIRLRKRAYSRRAARLLEATLEKLEREPSQLTLSEQARLRRLRARASTNRPALAFLEASLLHAEGRGEEALLALERARKVQTSRLPGLHAKRGSILLDLGRPDHAIREYEAILALDAGHAPARLGLAQCHLARRRPRRALAEATASIGLSYHQPVGHLVCAEAQRQLGDIEQAIASARIALSQNPVLPDGHTLLADCLASRGEIEAASRHRDLATAAANRIRRISEGQSLPDAADPDAQLARSVTLTIDATDASPRPRPEHAVIVVSGLPRSGTSMLMQMLAAGGIALLSDAIRGPDESNPLGYLEFEPVKRIASDRRFIDEATGKAVKIVAPLLRHLPLDRPMRVLFAERPLDEVLASTRAMIERRATQSGGPSPPDASRFDPDPDHALAEHYTREVDRFRIARLDSRAMANDVRALSVPYPAVRADPMGWAHKLDAFLGGGLDVEAMARAVEVPTR